MSKINLYDKFLFSIFKVWLLKFIKMISLSLIGKNKLLLIDLIQIIIINCYWNKFENNSLMFSQHNFNNENIII